MRTPKAAIAAGRTKGRTTVQRERSQIGFALAALAAGLAWGYLRHRRKGHAGVFSVLQGLEWFIAYGGAAALVELMRQRLEPDEDEGPERITRIRQVVTEQDD